MKLPSIKQLRQAGYLVRISHYRYKAVENRLFLDLQKEIAGPLRFPRGGLTVMELTTPAREDFCASAFCSLKDGFSRKVGVDICLERLCYQGAFKGIQFNEKGFDYEIRKCLPGVSKDSCPIRPSNLTSEFINNMIKKSDKMYFEIPKLKRVTSALFGVLSAY